MNLGKYKLHEQLGKGGFGSVYRATDSVLGVERALKVLHPALVADETFISRFKQEAQIAARLEHPNLVPVYDLGETDGRYYLAMKFMPGGSLKDLLTREGKLDQEHAFEILRQVAEGIGFAHKHNIIHRDLKPGNILFDQDGAVRVSDMGFAKALSEGNSTSLSATGGMIGTPSYMAPEIWRGKPALPASDIYSLGCILYEMLTGKVLFEGESPADVMTRHVLDGPQFTEELPEKVSTLINKALDRDPDKRYTNVRGFLADIDKMQKSEETFTKIQTSTTESLPEVGAWEIQESIEAEQSEHELGAGSTDPLDVQSKPKRVEPYRYQPNTAEAKPIGSKKSLKSKSSRIWVWIALGLIIIGGFTWILVSSINHANRRATAAIYSVNSTTTSLANVAATQVAKQTASAIEATTITGMNRTATAKEKGGNTATPTNDLTPTYDYISNYTLAFYPLSAEHNYIDLTGNNPLFLTNAHSKIDLAMEALYFDGTYDDYSYDIPVGTPLLEDLNMDAFRISVDFFVEDYAYMPVFMGGRSYRWAGFILEENGDIILWIQDEGDFYYYIETSLKYRTNEWQRAQIEFQNGKVKIQIDQELPYSQSYNWLRYPYTDKQILLMNFSDGGAFKGWIKNLLIENLEPYDPNTQGLFSTQVE